MELISNWNNNQIPLTYLETAIMEKMDDHFEFLDGYSFSPLSNNCWREKRLSPQVFADAR